MFDFEKRIPYRNSKILKAAKGQSCTIHSPWCNGNPETVVACHSNYHEDGKGAGQKADDIFVAFGCSDCHRWLDESHEDSEMKFRLFHRGMKATIRKLLDLKIIK